MGRHDIEVRKKATELIDSGYGKTALASTLAISVSIAEHRIHAYKAVGEEVFLGMGSKHGTYDHETRPAAVPDFLEGGPTRQEVIAKHAIAGPTAFERWAKSYREGSPEALEGRSSEAGSSRLSRSPNRCEHR